MHFLCLPFLVLFKQAGDALPPGWNEVSATFNLKVSSGLNPTVLDDSGTYLYALPGYSPYWPLRVNIKTAASDRLWFAYKDFDNRSKSAHSNVKSITSPSDAKPANIIIGSWDHVNYFKTKLVGFEDSTADSFDIHWAYHSTLGVTVETRYDTYRKGVATIGYSITADSLKFNEKLSFKHYDDRSLEKGIIVVDGKAVDLDPLREHRDLLSGLNMAWRVRSALSGSRKCFFIQTNDDKKGVTRFRIDYAQRPIKWTMLPDIPKLGKTVWGKAFALPNGSIISTLEISLGPHDILPAERERHVWLLPGGDRQISCSYLLEYNSKNWKEYRFLRVHCTSQDGRYVLFTFGNDKFFRLARVDVPGR